MKKIFLASALFLFVIGNVSAQTTIGTGQTNNGTEKTKPKPKPKPTPPKDEITIESFSWGATSATGAQTVPVPNGKGTLKFEKNGDKFTNVTYFDANGKAHRMQPTKGGTNGAPQTPCKYPLPDACFGTADKNIGMCICKPTDLSSGGYNVTLLLPAVQKVREAAARM